MEIQQDTSTVEERKRERERRRGRSEGERDENYRRERRVTYSEEDGGYSSSKLD